MALQHFADSLPDYARDLKLNIAALLGDRIIGDARKYGLLLACAHGSGHAPLVAAAEAEAAGRLDPACAAAARAAAALMAMNNVYYRFVHLASNPVYETLPARLSMKAAAGEGVDKADFELFCLAVSAQNGCGACIDSHEQALGRLGVKAEAIQSAVRFAAVMKAIATVHATLPGPAAA